MCDDWGDLADASASQTPVKRGDTELSKPESSDPWGECADSSKPKEQKEDDPWGPITNDGSDDCWGTTTYTDNHQRGWNKSGDNWVGKGNRDRGAHSRSGDDWGSNSYRGRSGGHPRSNDSWSNRGNRDRGGNHSRSHDNWGVVDNCTQETNNSISDDGWGCRSDQGRKGRIPRSDDAWADNDNRDRSGNNYRSNDPWGSVDKCEREGNKSISSDPWGATDNCNERKFSPKKHEIWGSSDMDRRRDNRKEASGKDDDEQDPDARIPYKPDQLNLEEEAELQKADCGENFQRYKDQKVTCIPPGAVKPIEKFENLIESELLLKNLRTLKYSEMTPIQKWAIPTILDQHDLIGCAQTGSGKTAAFLLPILQTIMQTKLEPNDPNSDCQSPFCLILSPTRELARQIYTHAEILSKDSIVRCCVIYGQVATYHLKSQISKGCHVLVATIGRLKDFLERGWINFNNIKYVILDEGDRLVDERTGCDLKAIFDHPTMPTKENRQTLFFSATFKDTVQESARDYLKSDFVFLTVGRVGAANEDIKQEFLQVTRADKKRELKKILDKVSVDDKTIVFTQTKAAADMLAAYFSSLKLESTSIHGDRHQSQREEAISLFRRGKKRFLISSPVGNRGLDLPKVALVINYDLPENIDEYVHRIGRTGRAGHTGRAISFYDESRDRDLLPDLLAILKEAKQEIPDFLQIDSGGAGESNFFGAGKRRAEDEAGNEVKKIDSGDDKPETNDDFW